MQTTFNIIPKKELLSMPINFDNSLKRMPNAIFYIPISILTTSFSALDTRCFWICAHFDMLIADINLENENAFTGLQNHDKSL